MLTPEEARDRREAIRDSRIERLRRADSANDRPEERPTGIGTGFRVDADGHLLTNHHVVEGCRRLRLRQEGRILGDAELVAGRPDLDVALLSSEVSGPVARFADSPPPAGRLTAVGYPVSGAARVESATARLAADPGDLAGAEAVFRFRGDLKPGNSGSPLLDGRGRVVGMATAERDRVKAYARTGELPPAGGIAIGAEPLIAFLSARGIAVSVGDPPEADEAAVLARARRYVVRIDCWR